MAKKFKVTQEDLTPVALAAEKQRLDTISDIAYDYNNDVKDLTRKYENIFNSDPTQDKQLLAEKFKKDIDVLKEQRALNIAKVNKQFENFIKNQRKQQKKAQKKQAKAQTPAVSKSTATPNTPVVPKVKAPKAVKVKAPKAVKVKAPKAVKVKIPKAVKTSIPSVVTNTPNAPVITNAPVLPKVKLPKAVKVKLPKSVKTSIPPTVVSTAQTVSTTAPQTLPITQNQVVPTAKPKSKNKKKQVTKQKKVNKPVIKKTPPVNKVPTAVKKTNTIVSNTVSGLQQVQTLSKKAFQQNVDQIKQTSKLQNVVNKQDLNQKSKILSVANSEHKTRSKTFGLAQKEAKLVNKVEGKKLDFKKKNQEIDQKDKTFNSRLPIDTQEYQKRQADLTSEKSKRSQLKTAEKDSISKIKIQKASAESAQAIQQNQDILNKDAPKKLLDIQKDRKQKLEDKQQLRKKTLPSRVSEAQRKTKLLTDQAIINRQNIDAQKLQQAETFSQQDLPNKLDNRKLKRDQKLKQDQDKFQSDLLDAEKNKKQSRKKIKKIDKVDIKQYKERQENITVADLIDLDTRNKSKQNLADQKLTATKNKDDLNYLDQKTKVLKGQKQLTKLQALELSAEENNVKTKEKINKDNERSNRIDLSTKNKLNKDLSDSKLQHKNNINTKRELAEEQRLIKRQDRVDKSEALILAKDENKLKYQQDANIIKNEENLDRQKTKQLENRVKRRKKLLEDQHTIATSAVKKTAEILKQQAKQDKAIFDSNKTKYNEAKLKERQDFDSDPINYDANQIKLRDKKERNRLLVEADKKQQEYLLNKQKYLDFKSKHPVREFVSRNFFGFGGGPPNPPNPPKPPSGGHDKNNKSLETQKNLSKDISVNFARGNVAVKNLFGSLSQTLASLYLIRRTVTATINTVRELVSEGVAFESNLKAIRTLSPNIKEGNLPEITDNLLNLSRAFGQDPLKVSTAFFEAVSSGALKTEGPLKENLDNVSKFQETIGKAAVGGRTDFLTAQKAILATINAYDLSLSDAERVSDAFFNTVNYGVVSFPNLVSSIGGVVSIAHQAGINIEDLSAAMAVATKRGITATEAVTGIRSAIANIIRPGAQAQKAAKEFGIDLSAAALKARGLIGVLAEIRSKNLDPGQISTLLPNIRAFLRTSALIGEGFDEYSSLFNKFISESGAASNAFEIMSTSVEFQVEQLKAEFNILGQQIYKVAESDFKELLVSSKEFVIVVGNLIRENNLLGKSFDFFSGVIDYVKLLTIQLEDMFQVLSKSESFFIKLPRLAVGTASGVLGQLSDSFNPFDTDYLKENEQRLQGIRDYDFLVKKQQEEEIEGYKKVAKFFGVKDDQFSALSDYGKKHSKLIQEIVDAENKLLEVKSRVLKVDAESKTGGKINIGRRAGTGFVSTSRNKTEENDLIEQISTRIKVLKLQLDKLKSLPKSTSQNNAQDSETNIIVDLEKKKRLEYSKTEDERRRKFVETNNKIRASLDEIVRYAKVKYDEDAKGFISALKKKIDAQKQAESKLADLTEKQRLQYESFEERSWEIITSGLEKPGELIQRFGIADTYEIRANKAQELGDSEETLRLGEKAQAAFEQIALRTDISPEEKEKAFTAFKRTQKLIEGSYVSQRDKQQEIIDASKKSISELSAKLTKLQADAIIKLQFQVNNNEAIEVIDRFRKQIKGINAEMSKLGFSPTNPDSIKKIEFTPNQGSLSSISEPKKLEDFRSPLEVYRELFPATGVDVGKISSNEGLFNTPITKDRLGLDTYKLPTSPSQNQHLPRQLQNFMNLSKNKSLPEIANTNTESSNANSSVINNFEIKLDFKTDKVITDQKMLDTFVSLLEGKIKDKFNSQIQQPGKEFIGTNKAKDKK